MLNLALFRSNKIIDKSPQPNLQKKKKKKKIMCKSTISSSDQQQIVLNKQHHYDHVDSTSTTFDISNSSISSDTITCSIRVHNNNNNQQQHQQQLSEEEQQQHHHQHDDDDSSTSDDVRSSAASKIVAVGIDEQKQKQRQKKKKCLRFDCSVNKIYEYECVPEQYKSEVWYSRIEFAEFSIINQTIALRIMKSSIAGHSWNDNDNNNDTFTTRGLEDLIYPWKKDERDQINHMAKQAMFLEQYRQRILLQQAVQQQKQQQQQNESIAGNTITSSNSSNNNNMVPALIAALYRTKAETDKCQQKAFTLGIQDYRDAITDGRKMKLDFDVCFHEKTYVITLKEKKQQPASDVVSTNTAATSNGDDDNTELTGNMIVVEKISSSSKNDNKENNQQKKLVPNVKKSATGNHNNNTSNGAKVGIDVENKNCANAALSTTNTAVKVKGNSRKNQRRQSLCKKVKEMKQKFKINMRLYHQ